MIQQRYSNMDVCAFIDLNTHADEKIFKNLDCQLD